MQSRFGLVGALLIASLCLAVGSTACSGGDDRDDTPSDGGSNNNTPDGGSNNTPDAGPQDDPNDHSIGAACSAEATGQRGDCDEGLICVLNAGFPGGLCTKPCVDDVDCGDYKGRANECIAFGNDKVCLRGCDPVVANGCGRAAHACNEEEAGVGVCITRCDQISGGCPQGLSCNAQSGVCEANETYDECGQTKGPCAAGNICVLFAEGAQDGICLKDCTADANACGAGGTCTITVGQNKACTQNCGGLTNPACPATAPDCAQVAQGVNGCVPPGPAGSQGSYQQCGGTFGACVAEADCLVGAQGATQGICLVDCTGNAGACTGDESCQSAGGQNRCLKPCDGGQTCPTGSACNQGFCMPAAP